MSEAVTLSLSKEKINILLLEGVHANVVDVFSDSGYTNVTRFEHALDENALIDAMASVHILGIRSRTVLSEKVLAQSPKLMAIGCFCIGTNQVALSAAAKRGVPVFNAPYANTRSVAELVLAEMICLFRGVVDKHTNLMQGHWRKSAQGAHEIRGKTLGIVGYGHIGSQLGVLAEHCGMTVYYYDIEPKLSIGNAQSVASLSALFKIADVVSLHVPGGDATKNLMDQQALSQMKQGAILINASRGQVVDVSGLCHALESGYLHGAAVDVFPEEPASHAIPFQSPLQQCQNVILTPHIGGATEEAQSHIGLDVANKLIKYSDNGSTMSAVNFPEVNLPHQAGHCRLLHIHWNKPGVLMKVNDALATVNANIVGQYLQTKTDIGYVVLDATVAQPDQLRQALSAIPETIKTRVLYTRSG